MHRTIATLAGVLALTLCASTALAEEAQQAASGDSGGGSISVAGLIGYGIHDSGGENGYGVGFGLRGGYTLDMGVYAGVTYVHHLGYSVDVPGGSASFGIGFAGVEGGYGIDAGPVTVRPELGLGMGMARGEACVTILGTEACGDASESALSLWPGASILYPAGSIFFGANARYYVVTGDKINDANAPAFYGTVGGSF
jgi:hypothetical protein